MMDTRNVEDVYPLSARQEYFFPQGDAAPDARESCGLHTARREDLNHEAFALAWRRVFERHPVLRTRFVWKRVEKPLKVVHREVKLPVEEYDWRGQSAVEQAGRWRALLDGERARSFNPAQAPLLRLFLCRMGDGETRVLCSYSVLLLDEALVSLLFDEVFATYAALRERLEPPAEDGRAFEVYRQWLEQRDHAAARAYWRRALESFTVATPLPANRKGQGGEAGATVGRARLEIDGRLADALRAFASQAGVSQETLFRSAWAYLLSYYNAQETVTFGVTIPAPVREAGAAARPGENHFNTLPVRASVAPGSTVREWLKEQQAEHERLARFAHSSLALVRQWVGLPPRAPLFESRVTWQARGADASCESEAEPLVIHFSTAPTVQLSAVFDAALLDEETVARLLGHLRRVLEEFALRPEQKLSSVSPLTEDETRRLLSEWSGPRVPYPSERCIHQLFEAQAALTPDAVAVLQGPERLSYRELNSRANQLAHHLHSLGVRPETVVALCCERSVEQVVALLGILKAGAAYVPLDPSYPLERLQFMLDDTRAPVLLTQERLVERLPAHWGQLICLDADWEEVDAQSEENPESEACVENLAYVIYTSGSTGQPKGVAVTHRGVVRLVRGTTYVEWGAGEVFLQAAPLTFDASTFEIWGSLLNGGRLALLESESTTLDELRRAIKEYKVTTLWLTAGLFHLMVDEEPESLREVRQLLAGGDVLSVEHVVRVLERMDGGGRLVNGYGPTESTTFTCCHTMTRASRVGQSVSIGTPIANTQVYLLNSRLQPVPVGVPGELLIGGDGLARGYINRPGLTAEKFVPHPFSAEAGARLYRTGDLARYLADGRIEYLERTDNQVKVRGFRIELGEIEAALAAHHAVRQCVVLAREDGPGEKHLVAYVVSEEGRTLDAAEARAYLRERLPEYMIPSQLVVLDAFPLTANGKVDRRALPAPEEARAVAERDHVAPRTAGEKVLAEIWRQVLGVERVGVNDNFFDLGGDSIRSIQIRAQAQKRGYEFTVQQVFQHQTIAELAREMSEADLGAARGSSSTEPFGLITPEDRECLPDDAEDAYPLSMLQEGMLFHSELSRQSAVYHDIFSFHVRAPLSVEALETAARLLAARHPVLRTSFALDGFSEPLQLVHRGVTIPFAVTDLSELSAAEQERVLSKWMEDEKRRDFDWSRPPFIRIHVFPRGAEDFQFTLSFHHAVIDGWSLSALLTELFTLYFKLRDGEPVPEELSAPLATTYRDFIALERRTLQSEEGEKYWTNKLASGSITTLPPRDAPAPPVSEQRMSSVSFDAETVEEMKSLARLAGVSLKNVLLAAHLKVFALLSGEREVVTGLVFNGRPEEVDGERVLGLFLNTLPFPLTLTGGTWVDLIQATAEAEREMMAFRLHPLAAVQRTVGRQPLFEIAFNYNHFHVLQAAREASEMTVVEGTGFTRTNIPFLAMFELNPHTSELNLLLEYSESRLSARQVEEIGNYYRRALSAMTRDPFAAYERASLLGEEERRRVVEEWNDTAAEYPTTESLHRRIERQVERSPDATALIYRSERLTYAELNARANQLAHHLRSLGVGPESLVGVLMERSTEMVVALLAVLKAGGAYVPLDPSHPQERLALMLSDTGAGVVLTHGGLGRRLADCDAHVISLDTEWPSIAGRSAENLPASAGPANLAYLIYTSGSTGQPKGVMNTHGGIVNRLLWMQDAYQLDATDCVLQKTPYGFDVSVWEFFWPLMAGARLVVAEPGGHRDPAYLGRVIREQEVTTLHFVPSMLQVFIESGELERCRSLRRVVCSGEALPFELQERFFAASAAELHNLYGPTEAAVDVTFWECERGGHRGVVPIGRPIANTQIYLLDAEMEVVPVGVRGELYIGGVGLARGYHGRAGLTAERFVPNPYGAEGGGRLYRTGDVARYMEGGEIEYLGRADYQVKVRGYRIELGEIEAALAGHEGVEESVVGAIEGAGGDKQLVAYYVAGKGEVGGEELRSYLGDRLPGYMVPGYFVRVEAMPLTANGKLDRKALAALGRPVAAPVEATVLPRTPLEELICETFAHVLGVERVGIRDHFFHSGGHSLLATRAVSRLRAALGHEVSLRDLFEAPTPEALAALVERTRGEGRASQAGPALVARRRGETAPLSFAQQRLWFLDRLEPDSAAFNISVLVRMNGRLDEGALERALSGVVRRHEALRTTFTEVDGVGVQVIREPQDRPLEVEDLSGLEPEGREAAVNARATAEAARPINLQHGPVMRARLLRLDADQHVLLLTMHHIASDGWSIGILVREVSTLYDAFARGEHSPLAELQVQYADYAEWQREWLQTDLLQKQLSYWRERLKGAPAALNLPADRPRPTTPSHRAAVEVAQFGAELTRGLKELGRREGATLFMALLAGWQALLSRYTGQQDIVVGSPVAGRTRAELEGLIGFFVNMLALRVRVSGEESFAELLRRVREECLGAYAHQEMPFEKLVEELDPGRDMSRHPIFQVMFVLQNTPNEELRLPELTLNLEATENGGVHYDLILSVAENEHGMEVTANYSADLFDAQTIRKMLAHFETLLDNIVAAPHQPLSSLGVLDETERLQQLSAWNDTRREYAPEKCIHELFEARAQETPDALALDDGGRRLTYAELNRRANQLAHYLAALGVGPETRVGVAMPRSAETHAALLGVLKAGGAYVPLDPAYPRERLALMLEDSGVGILLTQSRLADNLPGHRARVVLLDEDWPTIAGQRDDNPHTHLTADAAAYVIYTAGSTGEPKGVVGLHKGAVNHFRWMWENYPFAPGEVCCQQTSLSVVDSVWESFGPLLQGVPTFIFGDETLKDAELFIGALAEKRVTRVVLAPSLLGALLETGGDLPGRLPALRHCVCSGEALTAELAQGFVKSMPHCTLLNLYGSTELAGHATCHQVSQGEAQTARMSIGRPIANMRAYVLDEHMRLVPAGVPGELYVGGDGLARGYGGRPGLTAEKFTPDPFGAEAGARLYRTGDLARYFPDGSLEFLGRVDQQVKVRGFRIELEEIELTLKKCPGVRQSVVVAGGGANGEAQLLAYVAAEPERTLTSAELRFYVSERLPDYMLPSAFILVDELPLTPSRKVDRKALAALGRPAPTPVEDELLPRTPLEELICETFANVLGRERVGTRDHFFHSGGHSLLATRVVSRLHAALGHEVSLRELFEAPTAEALAARITRSKGERGRDDGDVELIARRRGETAPLSFSQQRLWFLDRIEPGNVAYNMPLAVRLKGRLSLEALERCLAEITRRHEILRTTFATVDAQPVHVIAPPFAPSLPVVDLSGLRDVELEGEVRRRVEQEALTPFDLSAGPLWRTKLLRVGETEHVMLCTMHHIITDGWSMDVLMREVSTLYAAFVQGQPSPLAELPIQYADYAVWQREHLRGERLERQLDYWRRNLDGASPSLELPTDRPPPRTPTHRGAEHSFTVPERVGDRLRMLGQQEEATPFIVLLAAFAAMISRYSGQQDIVLGTHVAGRRRVELEQLIGFFVNTLVLRLDVRGGVSFRELVRRAREVCLGAYANQDVPFDKLVEELRPERSLSHTPFFKVLLVFQNTPRREAALPGLTLEAMSAESQAAKFSLTLFMNEDGGSLNGTFVYDTDLFNASTIQRMAEHLQNLLRAAADEPDRKIDALAVHSEEAEKQVVYSFNDPLE